MTEDKLKQAIHQAIEQATVKIFLKSIFMGTGFFITSDGYVLTAFHCIGAKADIEEGFVGRVKIELGSGKILEAQLDYAKSVPDNDIAVLKVNYSPEYYLPLSLIGTGETDRYRGDVVASGYPAGRRYDSIGTYPGKISRFHGDNKIETKDVVRGTGQSGSALYHYETRRVIGVVSTIEKPDEVTHLELVVRLDPLFKLRPELHHINQEVAEIWEQKIKILTEEVAKTWEKRKKPQLEVQLTPRELRNRRDLLSQVKDEVNSRLKQSLHNARFINIDKESQPQQVKPRLWDVEVKVVSQPNESYFLPRSKEIIDIFDDEPIAGKLLILGEPGSGKTTTLLELAKELVNRAENNPAEPLPILLNFSSWKGDKSIDQWIIEELKSKYGVHKKIGKEWVESGQLLPLLDGLDELESSRQEPMINEINRFLESDKRPLYLVICSRREEYELQKVQLQLNAAICLQPLTEVQIRTYLRSAECLPLWESFQNDVALYELVKSPFFLSVMVLSAGEISYENWVQLNSSEERQQYLFEIYTKKMLSRNLKKRHYFRWFEPSVEETQHWLEELAIRLEREKESEFLVEKLQSREPAYRVLFAISSVLIAILIGLVTSFNQWYLPFSLGEYDSEPDKLIFITAMMLSANIFGIACKDFFFFDKNFDTKTIVENSCYESYLFWIRRLAILTLYIILFFSIISITLRMLEIYSQFEFYKENILVILPKVLFIIILVPPSFFMFFLLLYLFILGVNALSIKEIMGRVRYNLSYYEKIGMVAFLLRNYEKMGMVAFLIIITVLPATSIIIIMVAFLIIITVLTATSISELLLILTVSPDNIDFWLKGTIRGNINLIYWINFGLFINFWNYSELPIKLFEKIQFSLLKLTNGLTPLGFVFAVLCITGLYEWFQAIETSNIRWITEEPLAKWIHEWFKGVEGISNHKGIIAIVTMTVTVLIGLLLIFGQERKELIEKGKSQLEKLFMLLFISLTLWSGIFGILLILLLLGMFIVKTVIFFIIRCIMPLYYFISCGFSNSNCLIFHNIFFPDLFNYPDDILLVSLLIIGGLFYGIVGPAIDIDKVKFPNQGIRNTLINGIIFLLVGGLFFGTASLVVYDKQTSLTNGIIMGLIIGLFVGRAYLQHYVLRTVLWLKGDAPFFYVKFLDYATERMFLQRIGGRYRFIHKLLQKHFAKEIENQEKILLGRTIEPKQSTKEENLE